MVMVSAALAVAALAAAGAAAPTEPRAANACAAGLYMIVARGTNEPAGQGKAAQVAQMVAAQIPGSASVAVDYPATAFKKRSLYPESVAAGINDTIKKIHDYVAACGTNSRIALLGFSQGGNVMTDTLAGGVLKPDPLGDEYRQYIKAVTVFGDPSFSANHTYDYGSNAHGSMEGIFARHSSDSLARLQTYAGVLASYCDVNDAFCASGDNSNTVHGDEVPNHAQEATDFIVARAT